MATIRKLPSGKYNVQIRREGHPPLSDTFGTRTDAVKWARKIEGDIDEGKHYGFSRLRTLADAVDAFAASKNTIKTAADRDRHLAWWREAFGNRKLFHFTADVVEQGRERVVGENIEPNPKKPARHRAPQTVRHYLMSLSACMDYAKRKKRWIAKNPVADIDAPPVPLPDFRFHDLRHSAATEMLRAGVDSRIVATVLGDRSMNMMRNYAHVAPELVVDAAKRGQDGVA